MHFLQHLPANPGFVIFMFLKEKQDEYSSMQIFKTLTLFMLTLLLTSSTVSFVSASSLEIDLRGIADHVIDGDTFDLVAGTGTEYRVRLADVNANESGQPGYYEARDHLATLVLGKTVFLDVDDLYIWDNHGTGSRLVAVPYIETNSTHLLNICEALFLEGQVEKREYDNEFNPYSWGLYIQKVDAIPELQPTTLLLLMIACLCATSIYAKLKRRNRTTQ